VYVPTTAVFTLPLVAVSMTPLPSMLSIHVAPSSVNTHHCAIVILAEPLSVTTGVLPSVTFTVLVTTFPVFPATSVYVYSRVYDPTTAMFTIPLVAVSMTPLPSMLSIHVAPSSVNTDPCAIVILADPLNVTSGVVTSICRGCVVQR